MKNNTEKNETIAAKVGANIRAIRKAKGYTQAGVASGVPCSRTHVTNIELGTWPMAAVETLAGIASSMGVPLRELFKDL